MNKLLVILPVVPSEMKGEEHHLSTGTFLKVLIFDWLSLYHGRNVLLKIYMQKNSPFLVYSSVSFGKHIYSDNHHCNQHAEQLHNPQISLVTLVIKHSPQTPCSQPLGATNLFSVPVASFQM